MRVAFLRVAFFRVAFLRVACWRRVAFLRVACLRVAFRRVAFFRAAILVFTPPVVEPCPQQVMTQLRPRPDPMSRLGYLSNQDFRSVSFTT